jgi:L-lactate dehydrogenase complex protein LldG
VSALLEDFRRNAQRAGFLVHDEPFEVPAGAGVSRASYALAATGSVVFSSSTEPRAASILPEVHVTMVEPQTILPDLAALFATLGGDLPSALAIVTGPSASADIGQRHLVGIHGPREVHVVLKGASR